MPMSENGPGDGAPELVTAVRSAKQYLTYVSAGPFQYAVDRRPPLARPTASPSAAACRNAPGRRP